MALYAIGDLHLSLTANKPMEVFGPAWENYTERIAESLSALAAEDVLVLAGDTSWGMSLEEAEADFQFLDQFPCRKYLVKGNHDYWWTTAAKLHRFFDEKGIHTLDLLHNNCVFYGDYAVCGTRGWFLEEDAHNVKVLNREVGRLEASLKAAGEKPILCFLHYTKAMSARKSWKRWKNTGFPHAATAIFTATPSAGGWRENGEKRSFP